MSAFFGPLFWLILSMGILVTLHEFGHFWVARRCGVKVLRFSVGFGKPLWLRRGRDGTEYAIAAIPLGGYVRMLDEREADVGQHEVHQAFNRKPVWARIAIVAAGPLANLLLCVALLWAMLVLGRPDYTPEIGRSTAIAAESGFARGDVILSIAGQPTPTWTDAALALVPAALDRQPVAVEVRDAAQHTRQRTLHLEHLPEGIHEREALAAIGLVPVHFVLPPVVGEVLAGMPAEGVLQPGDHILRADGSPIHGFAELPERVEAAGVAGRPLQLEIRRNGQVLQRSLAPRQSQRPDGSPYWGIGIAPASHPAPAPNALLRVGMLEAVPQAISESWRMGRESLHMLVRMVKGSASLENISGPITIARVADRSADMGLAWFLRFLALVSLSLAIINLLPIPLLDGGHLLYYFIEVVRGRPLGERAMLAGQLIGLAVLACLMGLAFYNDLNGLFG